MLLFFFFICIFIFIFIFLDRSLFAFFYFFIIILLNFIFNLNFLWHFPITHIPKFIKNIMVNLTSLSFLLYFTCIIHNISFKQHFSCSYWYIILLFLSFIFTICLQSIHRINHCHIALTELFKTFIMFYFVYSWPH